MDREGQNRQPLDLPFIFGLGFQPVWSPAGRQVAAVGSSGTLAACWEIVHQLVKLAHAQAGHGQKHFGITGQSMLSKHGAILQALPFIVTANYCSSVKSML